MMSKKANLTEREIFAHVAEVKLMQRGTCADCAAWKPKRNQTAPLFGGCARGGTTTLHYGDVAYNHYTTDLTSCSAWEPK